MKDSQRRANAERFVQSSDRTNMRCTQGPAEDVETSRPAVSAPLCAAIRWLPNHIDGIVIEAASSSLNSLIHVWPRDLPRFVHKGGGEWSGIGPTLSFILIPSPPACAIICISSTGAKMTYDLLTCPYTCNSSFCGLLISAGLMPTGSMNGAGLDSWAVSDRARANVSTSI